MEGKQGRQIIRRISLLVLILSHASSGFDMSGFTGKIGSLLHILDTARYLRSKNFMHSTQSKGQLGPIRLGKWTGTTST